MIGNELDIEVKDTVLDPNLPPSERRIYFRKEGADTYYYKVWLYLEGPDLPFVESVTFTLDETFPNPSRTVRRTPSNPNCQLVIWTWRLFTIKATIIDKKGFAYQVAHELSYNKELTKQYAYEEVADESNVSARPTLVS